MTQDEFIQDWAEKANWPAVEWDYTEWEECLASYEVYKNVIEGFEYGI